MIQTYSSMANAFHRSDHITSVRRVYTQKVKRHATNEPPTILKHVFARHNFVKALLMHQYKDRMRDCNALDMASGQGGDLLKWHQAGAKRVVMVDCSDDSLRACSARYVNIRPRCCFKLRLVCADAFRSSLKARLHAASPLPFNVITCHFALHYAFESEQTVLTAFKNMTSHAATNARILITVPDATALLNAYNQTPSRADLYRIRFDHSRKTLQHEGPTFGHRYTFTLYNTLHESPEFLVYPSLLRRVAKQCHCYQVRSQPFSSLLAERDHIMHPEERRLFERIVVKHQTPRQRIVPTPWSSLTYAQQQLSKLYRTFVFIKK